MNVLCVSRELAMTDLAQRLQSEGCSVKLFINGHQFRDCQKGFVERTSRWEDELSWVGKDGLIVFDDVGYGKVQDELRAEGYRVFGGSASAERLETDRKYGQDVFRGLGVRTEPIRNFMLPGDAITYIREHPARYVVKQNGHLSSMNYVGMLPSGADVISLLGKYAVADATNVSLQKVVEGVEVSAACFFNGKEWVGPAEISFEHKQLCNGNLGPQTGEMGTLTFYDPDREGNKLFQEVLAPMTEKLRTMDFRGDFAVNCIVNQEGAFPIDVTARLGCPISALQIDIHQSPWHAFLGAIADGTSYDLLYRSGYGIVLTLALPPFPYEERDVLSVCTSDGIDILFRVPLTADEKKRIHFNSVQRVGVGEQTRYVTTHGQGYSMFVTGFGDTVEEAQQSVYALAEKIVVPRLLYRTDIGNDFVRRDAALLEKWGYRIKHN